MAFRPGQAQGGAVSSVQGSSDSAWLENGPAQHPCTLMPVAPEPKVSHGKVARGGRVCVCVYPSKLLPSDC